MQVRAINAGGAVGDDSNRLVQEPGAAAAGANPVVDSVDKTPFLTEMSELISSIEIYVDS